MSEWIEVKGTTSPITSSLNVRGVEWVETEVQKDGSISVRPKWISVNQAIPQEDTDCLVTDGERVHCSTYVKSIEMWQGSYILDPEIKYWMPLPAPPKVVNKKKCVQGAMCGGPYKKCNMCGGMQDEGLD